MELEIELPALRKPVRVRSMKVKEVNRLNDRAALRSGAAIDEILKACTLTEGIDPTAKDMLQADRNAIFFGVRRATFGDEYEFEVKCPHCGEKGLYEIDLKKIPVNEGKREFIEQRLKDPTALFPYQMKNGPKLFWRFSDATDIAEGLKIRRKHADSLITANLMLRIKKVEDLPEEIPLKRFIEDMELADAQEFSEFYRECEPGFDEKVQICCSNGLCSADMELDLPITAENFFKRSSNRGKRAWSASST